MMTILTKAWNDDPLGTALLWIFSTLAFVLILAWIGLASLLWT